MVLDDSSESSTVSLDLSVILPALKLNDDLLRCVKSVRGSLAGKVSYEIIVVVPDPDKFQNLAGSDVRVIAQQGAGIYPAMNTGLSEATGEYLYFIGQDDLLLEEAAQAIKQGIYEQSDLIVSDVNWGDNGVYKNRASRNVLVWRNWCHQGIFYKRERFIKEIGLFPVQFSAQADHYVNIVFSGLPGLKSTQYKGCVAWYSGAGYSAKHPDFVFRRAFPGIVYQYFGLFSYLMVVSRRLLLSLLNLMRPNKI